MSADPPPGDRECPKCGVEMESIKPGVGPPVQQLQLCPACYLVTWSDQNGMHVQQGVPVKKGSVPVGDSSWPHGKPEEC
jgi:hypothetical protein